jgi:hypothetical protein
VICSACSLVADFPDHPPRTNSEDSGIDSGPATEEAGRDAQVEAATDAARAEASVTSCKAHTECDADELCCGVNNSNQCVEANVQRCGDCDQGCTSARAPNCGQRVCECVPGTGKACDPGLICAGQGADAKCVECASSNDCAMVSGKPFCVANKCVECDRGAMLDSSADDVGCSDATDVKTPICGADNTCVGCDDSKADLHCPGTQVCSPGLGCGGCKADATSIGVSVNGCQESAPICKVVSDLARCVGCTTNLECKYPAGQGYCAQTTGQCSNTCDPDGAYGANGCTVATAPFCKPVAGTSAFACAACAAGDCTNGTFCATTGAQAGACVGCRMNADCNPNGLAPVCDQTSFTCRARTMADCAATPATPVIDSTGKCVQCINDVQCPTGQHCSPTKQTCGQCADSATCPLNAPTCNTNTGTCEASCTDAVCALSHSPATLCDTVTKACMECKTSPQAPVALTCPPERPLCSSVNTCVKCGDIPGDPSVANNACYLRTTGSTCLRTGNNAGKCGVCDPGAIACTGALTCNPTLLVCQ